MSLLKIRNTLNTRLAEIQTVLPTVDIAWENFNYEPVANKIHIRPKLLASPTRAAAQGISAANFESGIYQIDVYGPMDRGTAPLDTVVEAIRALFPRALRLVDPSGDPDAIILHIPQTPSGLLGMRENPFWRVRIDVPYFAYVFDYVSLEALNTIFLETEGGAYLSAED